MVDSLEKNRSRSAPEKPEGAAGKSTLETFRDSKEISKESEALSEGISEALESSENAESIETGEVSEQTGEGKKRAPAARMKGSGKGDDDDSAAAVKQFPPVEIMQVQIATKINKEIVALEKQAKKMMKNPGKLNAFHLTALIAKIRSLREILAMLTKATSEVLKELWVRFVKNKD